jgi:VCBS repeat-containing protein
MDARLVVAQAGAGASPRVITVIKPAGDQAITITLGGAVKLDLSAVANERITLVRVGDRLVILFDNQARVTLDPFYDGSGQPLPGIIVELAPGREVSGSDFAALFPITTDQTVLPAADAGPAAPATGANFGSTPSVDSLTTGTPLPLLASEDAGALPEFSARTPTNIAGHIPTATADTSGVVEAGVLQPGNAPFAGTPVVTGNVLANDSDPDFGDALTVTGVAAGAGSAPVAGNLGISIDGIYGALVLAADGSFTYLLTNGNVATDALAQGATGSDIFTYTMTDAQGQASTTTLTIVVTGSNDAPVFISGPQAADASGELPAVTGFFEADTAGGTLSFGDVDSPDPHATKAAFVSAQWSGGGDIPATTLAGLAGALTVAVTTDTGGTGNPGAVNWAFGLADADVDFLAQGETLVATYAVTVTDSAGATATQTVTITLTGTNDAPIVTGAAALAAISEDPASNPGTSVASLLGLDDATTGNDRATDVDGSIGGIAVVGQSTSGGHWEYSTNGGAAWTVLAASSSAALVLDLAALLRFVPDLNVQTTISTTPETVVAEPTIAFHAWDGTSAAPGSIVDLSDLNAVGGSTAYSGETATATIAITHVVDQVFTDTGDSVDLRALANDPATEATWFEDGNFLDAMGGDDVVRLPDAADPLRPQYAGQTFDAGAGDDQVTGGDSGDSLRGGAGADTLAGGGGIDTATYAATLEASSFTYNSGAWTVEAGGTEATDTLSGIEVVTAGAGQRFLLVSADSEFATIQQAVDAAADGDTILIAPGAYSETVTIPGKAITLHGIGAVTLNGQITVEGTLNGAFAVEGMTVNASGHAYGIQVTANSVGFAGAVTLDGVTIANAEQNGLAYIRSGNGSVPTLADTIGSISILHSQFQDNGVGATGGSGDILLYGYNRDLTITDVTISNPGIKSSHAQKAIQLRGVQDTGAPDTVNAGPYDPAGDVTITDLSITGHYTQDLIAVYRIADFASFSKSGVSLDAFAPWGLVNFDEVGGAVDLSSGFTTLVNAAPGAPIVSLQGLATNEAFTGTSGDDALVGRGGADTLSGGDGNDAILGGSGDDTLVGGADAGSTADRLIGGAGSDVLYGNATSPLVGANLNPTAGEDDRAIYAGSAGNYDVSFNTALQAWQVTAKPTAPEYDAGGNNTDTLYGIEGIDFGNNGTVDLDFGAPVKLFDADGHLLGSFQQIQAAVNAATDNAGQYIVAAAGTYAENITIDKGVELRGAHFGEDGGAAGRGSSETIVIGRIEVVTTANAVAIDGIELRNTSDNATAFNGVAVTSAADVTVAHSRFVSVGANGNADRAIFLTSGATGDIVIDHNDFSGTSTEKFSGAAWSSGVWSDGSAASLAITDNSFAHVRTGLNLDGYDNATSTISGNEFVSSGSGISVGVGGDPTITGIHDNTFQDVDTDFNLRNLTTDIAFDLSAGGTNNVAVSGGPDAVGVMTVIAGAGSDQVTGTAGADFFDGRGFTVPSGNDTFAGGGGDDMIFARDGTDVAQFAATLTSADFLPVSGIAAANYGSFDGWRVNATSGGEGTDTLFGVEVVQGADPAGAASGRFLLVGNGGFATIQAAVNAAHDGDTILVASGHYAEQVVVDGIDNLTISAAAGASVTIDAPSSLVQTATSSSGREVFGVVTVKNSTDVQITGIDVDGLGRANLVSGANPNFIGVFYRNSSGGLTDVDVTGIRDPYAGGTTTGGHPLVSGMQRGVGVQADNTTVDRLAFAMTGGSITDFQKNATVFVHADLAISGVTITGGGAQTINAQNGIQALDSTGTISGNVLSGLGFAGPSNFYSAGLLLFNSQDLAVTGNAITGANNETTAAKIVGVYVTSTGGGAVSGGEISGNTIAHVDYGIGTYGTIAPNGVDIHGNTITSVDFTDPSGPAGVDHAPNAALTTSFSVEGSGVHDTLLGAAGADTLLGRGGADYLEGRGGADTIRGGLGDDTIVWNASDGNDLINGGHNVVAGDDHDTLNVAASGHNLTLTAGSADFTITDGSDVATVSEVETVAITLSGGETVTVTGDFTGTGIAISTVTVQGADGNETVDAQGIAASYPVGVQFQGGGGDDTFRSGPGSEVFDGGSGQDKIVLAGNADDYSVAWDGTTAVVGNADGSVTATSTGELQFADHSVWLVGLGAGADYTTIQSALAAAQDGDTILVGPGTYGGNIVLDKEVTILGSGPGTIIQGSFLADNNVTGTVESFLTSASSYNGAAGSGFTVAADNVAIRNLAITGFLTGIELDGGAGNPVLSNTVIADVAIASSVEGIHKSATAGIAGLTITGSSITDGHIGIDFPKTLANAAGAVTSVTIDNVSFSHLTEKGIYVETLSGATLTDITMTDVGEIGRTLPFGPPAQYGDFGSGIDINLKNGTYSGIVIDGFTFTDVGDASSGGHGAAIAVKVRNDGPSYDGAPAQWTGSALVIANGTIDHTSTGIRVGEPGKATTGIETSASNVAITDAGYDADNVTGSVLTVTLPPDGDTLFVVNPATTIGKVVVVANAHGDTITTGQGADEVHGGAGADIIDGGGGTDLLRGNGGADALTGGGGTDTAGYGQIITAAMLRAEGGGWTVTTSGPEGNDTLSGIEIVQGNDPDAGGIATGRFLLVGNGGFATVSAAYAAAQDGDTIVLAPGTHSENLVIGKTVTIVGANFGATGTNHVAAESAITGTWTINNPTGQVVIDGVQFLNAASHAGNGLARLTIGSDAIVRNSVFYNTQPGGNKPINDLGIDVTAGSGQTVSISGNLFTGDSHGKYFAPANGSGPDPNAASWGLGAIVWHGGSQLSATGNTIVYARTGMTLTGDNALLTITDNRIEHSGTGLALAGLSGSVTQITGTQFNDVDNEVNDRFNSAAVTIDFGATGNAADGYFSVLGGQGGDTIVGTGSKDAILANGGDDTVHARGGDDSVFVNAGTGSDIVDGGSETTRDTLVVSNVVLQSPGNSLDPGDVGDPASTTSGNPSSVPVTFTMTPDATNTVHPTDGTDSPVDILVTMSGGGQVRADEIEDVRFNLGSGGDTVVLSGDFSASGLATSTITVNGGGGSDTVDASGLVSPHGVVFHGGGGTDTFTSGAGNDRFDGGAGTDVAVFAGNEDGYQLAYDPVSGRLTVTDIDTADGNDGTDTLDGVEQLQFADGPHTLGPVLLFNAANDFVGDFGTIQAAVDAAGNGYTVRVSAGAYAETVTISEPVDLTIVGANVGLAGSEHAHPESILNGSIVVATSAAVVIDGMQIEYDGGSGYRGISVAGTASPHLTIANNLFYATVAGGAVDARAISLPVLSGGDVVIADNLFTGATGGKYETAAWGRGIWADGGGHLFQVTGNVFDATRSGMTVDGAFAPGSTISHNAFENAGTGLSFGSAAPLAILADNSFANVDTDINGQNLTAGFTFDAGASHDASTDPADPMLILGGKGSDVVAGTDGVDIYVADPLGNAVPDSDSFTGGKGNDFFYGTNGAQTIDAGQDTFVLSGKLADYDLASGTEPFSGSALPATIITDRVAGRDGVDTVVGTERLTFAGETGGPLTVLLVGAGGYTTIQAAIDAAQNGDTILIAPGTYSGNFTVSKELTIIGSAGTVIAGTFKTGNYNAADLAADKPVADWLETAAGYGGTSGTGITIAADNVTIRNLKVDSFVTGIELGDGIDHVRIENVTIEDTVNGIRKGTAADVNDLVVSGGSIRDSYIGVMFAKSATVGDGLATGVTIDGTTFSNLTEKGIYAETLSNALITHVVMTDVGEFGRAPAFAAPGQVGAFGNGIDINLKYGSYSGITIDGFTFANVGSSNGAGAAEAHGGAIVVKARDDGPSYNGTPATYTGTLVIANGTIDGTSTGIRAGEAGKTIGGPEVTVTSVAIAGALHTAQHGDIDNVTQSTMTVALTGGVDTFVASPTTTGSLVIHAGGAADAVTTGHGGDTLFGDGGNDALTGASGTDTAAGYAGAGWQIRIDAGGHWTVHNTGTNETDTLTGIERVVIDGTTYLLVDRTGTDIGGFQSVQAAINAASGSETILIAPGTYGESAVPTEASGVAGGLYINKAGLTLQGVAADGSPITTAAGAMAFGATIIALRQSDFGSNHFIGAAASDTTIAGLHLQAGPQTNNKLLEIWGNNAVVENSYLDVNRGGTTYSGAVAVYFNDNGTTASDAITAYAITHNILNEGIVVANGVGDPGLGVASDQIISDNSFTGHFDAVSGGSRYAVLLNGEVQGVGSWLLESVQLPTITGNSVADNSTPILFRFTDQNLSALPDANEVKAIVAGLTNPSTTFAYVLDGAGQPDPFLRTDFDFDGNPATANGSAYVFHVVNTIATLNLGQDTVPDPAFPGQRIEMDPGDTIVVQSGSGAVDATVIVDALHVEATVNSADLNLTLGSGVTTLLLDDYDAVGLLGANVDVTGNSLGNTIIGNAGANALSGGLGSDLLAGGLGNDILTGGANDDIFSYGNPLEGSDSITDFNNTTEQDTIEVSAAGFGGGLTAGMDVATVFGSSGDASFASPSERFHFDTSNQTLYYSASGSAGSAIALAQLEAGVALNPQDLHVVA